MGTDGSATIKWPDDERIYRLGIGELQDKCDAGPAEIFTALSKQTWRFDHIRETIRLGLIGGGLPANKAMALVGRYVVPGRLMEAAGIAQMILFAALVGDPDDDVPKLAAETSDGSTSRPSTDQEPSSDGRLETSINS